MNKKQKRLKKLTSLVIAVTIVFATVFSAFAEEVTPDSHDTSEDVEICDDNISENQYASPNIVPEIVRDISENFLSMSENLTALDALLLSGNSNTYVIVHERAVGYGGFRFSDTGSRAANKGTATGIGVRVYYAPVKRQVSGADIRMLTSENRVLPKEFHELRYSKSKKQAYIKKIIIKSSKGATVKVNGEGTVPVKNCTYISNIVLSDMSMNKELKGLLKKEIQKIRKSGKDIRISANGCKAGGTYGNEEDMFPLVIAVYPAYIGTCNVPGNNWRDVLLYLTGSPFASGGIKKIKTFEIGTKNIKGMYKQTMNVKNGEIKSIKAGVEYIVYDLSFAENSPGDKIKYKAVTLKTSKDNENNPKGLASSGEKYTYIQPWNGVGDVINKVETNGNFFGTIFYDDNLEKYD